MAGDRPVVDRVDRDRHRGAAVRRAGIGGFEREAVAAVSRRRRVVNSTPFRSRRRAGGVRTVKASASPSTSDARRDDQPVFVRGDRLIDATADRYRIDGEVDCGDGARAAGSVALKLKLSAPLKFAAASSSDSAVPLNAPWPALMTERSKHRHRHRTVNMTINASSGVDRLWPLAWRVVFNVTVMSVATPTAITVDSKPKLSGPW